jgi:putative spermidine/putrescine transport system permease protein
MTPGKNMTRRPHHYGLVFLIILLFVAPVGILVLQSFGGMPPFPRLMPQAPNLSFWSRLSSTPFLWTALLTSAGYSFLAVLLALVLTYSPARYLAWNDPPGRALWEALLTAPAVLPVLTTALGLHLSFTFFRWTDSFLSVVVILTFYSYPYMLRALTAGFEILGPENGRCAKNLGASPWTIFRRVELPRMIFPIISGGSVVFLAAFSDFFVVFLFGGGRIRSFTGMLMPALGSSNQGGASALTLVFLLIPLLMFGLLEGLFFLWSRRRGITA